jgi:pilus assembly protein CpaB
MRSVFLIAVALSCGLVAAVGVFQYLDKVQAAGRAETSQVLVAARDINISEALNEENVQIATLPRRLVQPGTLSDLKALEDKFARVRLYPGEPILQDKLMGSDGTASSVKVPPGYRVVSVKVTSESSVSSLIEPGDRVDVIVVLGQPHRSALAFSKTILKAVRVFAVNSDIARNTEDLDKTVEQARTVSVLLEPDHVEKLMMAAQLGTIRLALRSPEDTEVAETSGCTMDELIGRGDVADVVSDDGSLDPLGQRSAPEAPQTKAPAPQEDAWWMVIESPTETWDWRWQEEGGRPRRGDQGKDTQLGQPQPQAGPDKVLPSIDPLEQLDKTAATKSAAARVV